jgi:hypothetical protein
MTLQTAAKPSLLEAYPFGRIRRNHGLEHATLHVLSRRFPHLSLAGYSDPGGFWIIGDVSTVDIQAAVEEALQRLRSGEGQLAQHPNCGTNYATAGAMAGLAAVAATLGAGPRRRDKLERLPLAISLATLALILSRPVGMFLQARLTTSGEPGSLVVQEIRAARRGRMQAHRIATRE